MVGLLLTVIVRAEYSLWGLWVADRILGLAGLITPPRKEEWEGLLAERQEQLGIPCVLLAADLALASLVMRLGHVRGKLRTSRRDHPGCFTCWLILWASSVAWLPLQVMAQLTGSGDSLTLGLMTALLVLGPWGMRGEWRHITVDWVASAMTDERYQEQLWTRAERLAAVALERARANAARGIPRWRAAGPVRRYAMWTVASD